MSSGKSALPLRSASNLPAAVYRAAPGQPNSQQSIGWPALQDYARAMFDTHCHLTFPKLAAQAETLLADARTVGVRGVITVATTSADSIAALEMARNHDNVWCSAGVHPLYADKPAAQSRDYDAIRKVGSDPKCVAWGELGLDNHYDEPAHDVQVKVLHEQLNFLQQCAAEGMHKPVIVHCRDAFDELIDAFAATTLPPERFVFHCFTGTPDDARSVLDFGSWISFTGIATFANAAGVAEAAQLVPDDRIMVETDAPYLSPEPVRTTRPNVPAHVVHTARFLAELRSVDYEEFERMVDANAERFFGIKIP